MTDKIIVWFRQDLRITDNPALYNAAETADIIPIYILEDDESDEWAMGAASRIWTHHSLENLNTQLDGKLYIQKGNALDILQELIEQTGATAIYWNRCYEPWRINRDKAIKETLSIECKSFNGSLLWEPWHIQTQSGTPYKVFTPFYKKGCLNQDPPRKPLDKPKNLNIHHAYKGINISDLKLLPPKKEGHWHHDMLKHWDISEKGAHDRLESFLDNGIQNYKEGRNFPNQDNVSKLSPYLHHGQLSPNQVWYASQSSAMKNKTPQKDLDTFHSELGWREFSYNLLYHFPKITRDPLQENFKKFPWRDDIDALAKWEKGQTGFPIVDAAMRELWATGYMHNRCRMIVGSFLVKNLLLHWHEGEEWFWDCLVDADLASNSASWQWIAGCGADAAPYFRIFNPILQSKKFDEDGAYIKHWIPELKALNSKHIHAPWEADETILKKAGIELGKDYPKPIIEHSKARERALEAYERIKKSND